MNREWIAQNHNAPEKLSKQIVGEMLVKLGKKNKKIIVCDADLMSPAGTKVFKDEFPDRHFNMGIAEQNMVGVASGLALEGNTVFASTFANFAAKRACDQMSICAAYNRVNVKLCGIYAGLTCEKNGGTHIAVEDIAIMRAIPGMCVLEGGDITELGQIVAAAADYEGPVYIRIPKMYKAVIFNERYKFTIGKAETLTEGEDIAICACGIMSGIAFQAAEVLKKKGVYAKVINFSTIKPIDQQAVLEAAKTGYVLTVENHSIIGGLGSAVMEVLSEHQKSPAIQRLGIPDVFGVTASLDYQLDKSGLSMDQIVRTSLELLSQK